MEKPVNKRIVDLKAELGYTNAEFCVKAKISNGTLANIINGENVNQKTLNSICEGLGISKDWLLTGKGERLSEAKIIESDPWRDALVQQMKQENNMLANELNRVWAMVNHLTGGKIPSFHKGVKGADAFMYQFPGAAFSASLTPQVH